MLNLNLGIRPHLIHFSFGPRPIHFSTFARIDPTDDPVRDPSGSSVSSFSNFENEKVSSDAAAASLSGRPLVIFVNSVSHTMGSHFYLMASLASDSQTLAWLSPARASLGSSGSPGRSGTLSQLFSLQSFRRIVEKTRRRFFTFIVFLLLRLRRKNRCRCFSVSSRFRFCSKTFVVGIKFEDFLGVEFLCEEKT